ncbi:TetR/AcrR family transcriptional regulator [Jiangella anatolica]|uniref:TetR family transcriptional regulator n=1 Tax=Jiangella anatolica TaxID=2670374 RepID=A0A2W2C0W5_9ACTN|nr:TetR/AcrR family transcriptional regulator [Jiangella anatolica]PZF79416.1 TetR family transcriptional regulator [Jiangella anatolica]
MDPATKSRLGRPRGFDTEDALERATRVFWEQGYDGASLADLTAAMGITRTSMYAAFGNKDELFRLALERYTRDGIDYVAQAMDKPTAEEVARTFLVGAAQASTRPGYPPGCLGVQGSLAAGATAKNARDVLVAWRNDSVAHLRDRFQRAIDEGDLPATSKPTELARYVMTVANGMAVQAVSGATRAELEEVAKAAMKAWPPL